MGRRRRNRTRKRSRRAHQVAIRNMERMAEESEQYEKHREAHNAYCQEVAALEREHLERTVFVTHVNNLRLEQNKEKLKRLFSRYGDVQDIELVPGKRRNIPPRARVTFREKSAAEGILREASRNDNKIEDAGVGYKGFLVVLPATPSKGGVRSDDNNSRVTFQSLKLSLGHWISPSMLCDDPSQIQKDGDWGQATGGLFLEEESLTSSAHVSIDFKHRTVRIEVGNHHGNSAEQLLGIGESSSAIVFRWKTMDGSIEFCRESEGPNAGHSLVFASAVPPKIFATEPLNVWDIIAGGMPAEQSEERRTQFFGLPLSRCLGFRMHVTQADASNLLSKRNISDRLRNFGLIRDRIYSLHESTPVTTQHIHFGAAESELNDALGTITDRKTSLLATALIDGGKGCWYRFLHDRAQTADGPKSFFQLAQSEDQYLVEKGLEQMLALQSPTFYPARVLLSCLEHTDMPSNAEPSRIDNLPDYCMEVPRVLVTPTRNFVVGYDIEMSNRVIRHFVNDMGFDVEDFIRVTFGDEDGSMIFPDDMTAPLCDRIRSIILNGLSINGRMYMFLAYSSSQLKERSFWMVCRPESSIYTVRRIRDWMGDFSSIHSPSKYGARMGQCFSTTIQAGQAVRRGWFDRECGVRVNDSLHDIAVIGDEGKIWCHSDGTGIMDKDTALLALQDVPFCPQDPRDVSIVQIRSGGCKGTVSVWDIKDLKKWSKNTHLNRMQNVDVFFRPSMKKFDAEYHHIEIVSVGTHVPYHLNRQMVMLLDTHGVPGDTLVHLQRNMLNDLDRMMESPEDAFEVLPSLSGMNNFTKLSVMRMLRAGMSPREEPFLFSCLHAVRSHHLMNLRKKTRIRVEKGAVLMGGIDETGLLPEFCVFLQVRPGGMPNWNSSDPNPSFQVITGPVLVAKHPVMHPGDLRMLYAVDIPQLHGHKNVLLFSQKGQRPEPHKMAGSDLDGDQFAVAWDDRIFFKKWKALKDQINILPDSDKFIILQQANHDAMMFDDAKLPEEVDKVSDGHLANHFINHAKSDSLGQISMLWLDWASREKRADCPECLKLAELHSIAVDFPKSGIPAEIPRELRFGRSARRAHWRERKDVESYYCESTVGRLYDDVIARVRQDKNSARRRKCPATASRRWNNKGQLLCFFHNSDEGPTKIFEKIYRPVVAAKLGLYTNLSGWEHLVEDKESCIHWALAMRKQYDEEVLSIMNRYKVHSEGELVTGCIKKFHKLSKRRQHDVSESIRRQYQEIRSTTRKELFAKVLGYHTVDEANEGDIAHAEECIIRNDEHFSEETEFARKLAAACYEVTYSPHFRGGGPIQTINEDFVAIMCEEDDSYAFFSFPWVFADIISRGLLE